MTRNSLIVAALALVASPLAVACSSEDGAGLSARGAAPSSGHDDGSGSAAGAGAEGGGGGGPRADASAAGTAAGPDDGTHGSGGPLGDSLGPCSDCRVHVPPSYSPGTPVRLVVALHGDEGRDGRAAATAGVIALWGAAADAAGFIVLAPACPAQLGCNGAWSDWLAAESYQPSAASLAWLDQQVDALEAKYDLRASGEYLAGHSGGAYWLGYYAQARAARFAGVAFVAGGMPAYTASNACPTCKLPGYFLGGSGDPRTPGQMSDTATSFKACGQEVTLDLFAGDHEQTIASLGGAGKAAAILSWFIARPRACSGK